MQFLNGDYVTIAFIITQYIQLCDDQLVKKTDLNDYSLFYSQKKTHLPIELTLDEKDVAYKPVHSIAYMISSKLTFGGEAGKETLKVAKNSLKVIFFKHPADISIIGAKELIKEGELLGAFDISQDWESGLQKDNNFTFDNLGMESVNWNHQLLLRGFESKWGFLWKIKSSGLIERKPTLRNLSLSVDGVELIPGSSPEIQLEEGATLDFTFTLSLDEIGDTKMGNFKMKASKDQALLEALEEKWNKVSQSKVKNQHSAIEPVVEELGESPAGFDQDAVKTGETGKITEEESADEGETLKNEKTESTGAGGKDEDGVNLSTCADSKKERQGEYELTGDNENKSGKHIHTKNKGCWWVSRVFYGAALVFALLLLGWVGYQFYVKIRINGKK